MQVVDHDDVHRRVVDLDDVQRGLDDERTGRNLGIRVAGCRHAAAMNFETSGALQTSIDGWARRAGHAQQPTLRGNLLDQINDAQRPGLLAQRVVGLLDTLLLLVGQPRRQWLPSAGATGNGRGLVDLGQTCAVAVDRCSVNAEPLGQSFGPSMRHRRIAQRAQGLCDALKLAPSLIRHALESTWRAATNWKRLPRRL